MGRKPSLNFTCLDSRSDDSWLGLVKDSFCAPPVNGGVLGTPTRGFFVFVCVNECTSVCKYACGGHRFISPQVLSTFI